MLICTANQHLNAASCNLRLMYDVCWCLFVPCHLCLVSFVLALCFRSFPFVYFISLVCRSVLFSFLVLSCFRNFRLSCHTSRLSFIITVIVLHQNAASSKSLQSIPVYTHVPSKANQHLHARHFKLGPTVFAFSVCSCGVFFFFSFFFRTHTLVNYTLVTIEHNNKTHLTSSNIKPAYL